MPTTKGYHSYRGKGGAGRVVLVVLLCLILLAAVGFLILQRYAVYDSEGNIRFELPWRGEKKPDMTPEQDPDTPPADEKSDVEIIIEESPKTQLRELHIQELDQSALRGGAEAALAALPEDINAVAVRVKNSAGELLYDSKLSEAIDAGAVKGGSISRAAIEALTASDRYTVARINATHDSIYSFAHMRDAGVLQLKHQGYIWYDPDSTFYLAPEKSAARAYITAIAQECAEMGFNELLFDEFGYPPRGRLSNIDESARTMTKQEALSLLADELRESVKEQKVKLSVVLDAQTVLAGSNEKTGQVLSSLAAEFDRIYVPTTAEQLPALTAAMEPYDAELVPVLSGPAAEGSYLLAAQG